MLRYVYCLNECFLYLFHTWKIIQWFAHNPLTAFDDKLKGDFIYAWSLPAYPTFENKMALIKVAMDEAVASPPHDCLQTLVFYFTHKIHEAVQVSCLDSNCLST